LSTDFHAPAPALSASVSSFKIRSRTWKVEKIIQSIRTKVVKKRKMVETFGAPSEKLQAEESDCGKGMC
jgi:hypothetical protein